MKTRFLLSLFLFTCIFAYPSVPAAYKTDYATLAGKSGVSLFDAITVIASKNYHKVSYDGLDNAFRYSDLDANGKVWDMYSTCSFTLSADACGNYRNVCDCWNKEHSLPKSWWGGSSNNCYSDMFHLVPTDGKVNNQRSNYPFGECSEGTSLGGHALGRLGSSTLTNYSSVGTVFEPDDQYKGDFARNYFGMIIRYGKTVSFTSGSGSKMFSNSSTSISATNNYGLTPYAVALLMKWHRQDSVSTKEENRNDGIQSQQGNRNPFIDCPVLAEYFWGTKAGNALVLQDLVDCGCVYGTPSSETPDTPDTPDTPENPDSPDTPDTPENPDTPDTPENPETPDAPDTPDTLSISTITVAQARNICAALGEGATTSDAYYVKGWVKKVYADNATKIAQYHNASFYMVDNIGDTDDFIAWQVTGNNGEDLTSAEQIAVGDRVIVYGKLKNFKGTTYETVGYGESYIYYSSNPLMNGHGTPTNVEQVAFPSLSVYAHDGSVAFYCLPNDAGIYVFNASGCLMRVEQTYGSEYSMSLPQGFYIFIVSSGCEKRSFKVVVD